MAARSYAEKAKVLYERIEDRANTGKLLTTLGGLTFLLGKRRGHRKTTFVEIRRF